MNLRRFAESVIQDGKPRGRMLKVGNMSHFLGVGIARRSGFARNEPIYIDDKAILKYVHHPKKAKGATVPTQYMNLLKKAIQRPQHIYRDNNLKNKGSLVFVGIIPKSSGKVIKAVIHTGYSRKGMKFHYVKSFGVVAGSHFKERVYTKIK